MSRAKTLREIEQELGAIEVALERHPSETYMLYENSKVYETAVVGADGAEEGTAREVVPGVAYGEDGLTPEEGLLVDRFVCAASFVSAWYQYKGNTREQIRARLVYSSPLERLGMSSSDALARLEVVEDRWLPMLESTEIESRRSRAGGCLLLLLVWLLLL